MATVRESLDAYSLTGKNILALLRDSVLVLLFVLLMANPAFIGERLSSAGFEEGEMMGFKWKKRAEDYGAAATDLQASLEKANRTIAQQRNQLTTNQDDLRSLRGKVTDTAGKADIDRAIKGNAEAISAATATQSQLVTTLNDAQPALVDARANVLEIAGKVIVISSDKTLAQATFEAKKATRQGFPAVSIFLWKGYYATVVIPKGKPEHWLRQAKKHLAEDAFFREFETWCPRTEPEQGYTRCIGV